MQQTMTLRSDKFRVVVTGIFDLGYSLISEQGEHFQLRLTGMKGRTLMYYVNGIGEELIGTGLEVFDSVTYPGRVSELTQLEVNERAGLAEFSMGSYSA